MKTRAIVLSREIFGEADLYVQFLTRDFGVVSLLAKAARKSKRRYVGGLDLFCHDEINVKGELRERGYLVDLVVINSFTILRDNLEKMLLAGQLVQWVRKLANVSIPIPLVYSLLGQTLALLETESAFDKFELLGLVFRLKLLHCLGIHPRTDACARCDGDEEMTLFDIGAGGLICSHCRPSPAHWPEHGNEHWELEQAERDFMGLAKDFKLPRFGELQFPATQTQRLTHLVTQFAQYHTHLRLPL